MLFLFKEMWKSGTIIVNKKTTTLVFIVRILYKMGYVTKNVTALTCSNESVTFMIQKVTFDNLKTK